MDVYSRSKRPKPATGLCEIRLLLDIQYVDAVEGIAGGSTFFIPRDGTALDRRVGVDSSKFRAILQAPEAEAAVIGSGKGIDEARLRFGLALAEGLDSFEPGASPEPFPGVPPVRPPDKPPKPPPPVQFVSTLDTRHGPEQVPLPLTSTVPLPSLSVKRPVKRNKAPRPLPTKETAP